MGTLRVRWLVFLLTLAVMCNVYLITNNSGRQASHRATLPPQPTHAAVQAASPVAGGSGGWTPSSSLTIPDGICVFVVVRYITANWTAAYKTGFEEWMDDMLL